MLGILPELEMGFEAFFGSEVGVFVVGNEFGLYMGCTLDVFKEIALLGSAKTPS